MIMLKDRYFGPHTPPGPAIVVMARPACVHHALPERVAARVRHAIGGCWTLAAGMFVPALVGRIDGDSTEVYHQSRRADSASEPALVQLRARLGAVAGNRKGPT